MFSKTLSCNLCPLQTVAHIQKKLFLVFYFTLPSCFYLFIDSVFFQYFYSIGTSGSALVCSTGNPSWYGMKLFPKQSPFYWCLHFQLFSATSSCIPNPVSYFIALLGHTVRSTETEIHWLTPCI